MEEKFNLHEFLNSNKDMAHFKTGDEDWETIFAKMHTSIDGIVYVFKKDYCRHGILNPFELDDYSFLGVYNSNEDRFYFLSNFYFTYSGCILDNLNYDIFSNVKKDIERYVNEYIIEKIKFDENNLFLSKDEIEGVDIDKDDIERLSNRTLIHGEVLDINSYAKYEIDSIRDRFDKYLSYIKDKSSFIKKISEEFIEKEKVYMYRTIVLYKRAKDYIESKKDDMDYRMIRELNKVLRDKDKKSFNIKYKVDDKELNFKYEQGQYFNYKNDYLTIYRIIKPSERKAFEEMFDGKIRPQHIETITYSKKVLYDKSEL